MADSFGTGRGRDLRDQDSPASSNASPTRHSVTQRNDGQSANNGSDAELENFWGSSQPAPSSNSSNQHSEASNSSLYEQFAISRREFEFDEEEVLEPAPLTTSNQDVPDENYLNPDEDGSFDIEDETIGRLWSANDESYDYYTLLGLPKEPPPTVAEIRAAYHQLSLAFHPDKHPHYLKASAQKYFTRLQKAYETLVEPRKRIIYDLEGEEGLQNEYKTGGAMVQGGEAEKQLGIKVMSPDEFRKWFMGVLLERERRSIEELVGSTTTCKLVLNAENLFSGSPKVGTFRPTEAGVAEIEFPAESITCQALQFRQSFSVALPGLGKLLQSRFPSWKEIIRGEASFDDDGEDDVAKSNWEDSVGPDIPKITFSTGVSGPTREIMFTKRPNQNRSEELERPLFRWYTLHPDNKVQLSARLNHSFTDAGCRAGINSITALMSGVDLDVTAGILPQRSFNIGIGRLVTFWQDTTPFHVQFRTLFNSSLVLKPPVLDMSISRSFEEKQFGYCRWSSGDFGWPQLAFMTRMISMKPARIPLWLPQGPLMSNMTIGYFQIEGGSQMRYVDDEDGIPILDSDFSPGKPSGVDDAADKSSWHFKVDSSPYNTSMSMTWGREIFCRAAARPLRSRIRNSGEAITRSRHPYILSLKGLRTEVECSMNLDLSLSGTVRGVRRIGDFTTLGVGVGLNPERGLFISISWNRLGQNIIVPVILVSSDDLDFKSILWGLAVPCITYVAIEFGILRPRLQKKRQRLVAKARKELRENVSKRKVEAGQATILMRPLVGHRQDIEREQGGLVILRAEYGVRASTSESQTNWRPGEVADVTVALAALIRDSQLSLPRGLVKDQIIGFWDPSPLKKKLLVVDYLFRGKRHHVKCGPYDALSLPMRAHEI